MEAIDSILSSDQAADFLGISMKTLYRRIEDGTVPYTRIAGLYFFDRSQLAKMEKGRRRPGRKPQQVTQ
ncbi:MAG: helix-turn-helix domain-containing protein [Pseudomonadota bacterium]